MYTESEITNIVLFRRHMGRGQYAVKATLADKSYGVNTWQCKGRANAIMASGGTS